MKLRNKKTGEIAEFIDLYVDESVTYFRFQDKKGIFKERINSLSEFNAEWEDYEPKEPLIKDEKIDYFEIKRLVKDAMREAEEERVNRLAQYYAELCGEEE